MTPQPAPATGLSRIGQIAMTVTNLGRAIEFYRDTLGLKFLFEASGMAFFDCEGIRLMLGAASKPGESFSSIVYFRVDDIGKAAEALKARGVQFENGPALVARLEQHDLWLGFFRDPDRNLLALMSEAPRG